MKFKVCGSDWLSLDSPILEELRDWLDFGKRLETIQWVAYRRMEELTSKTAGEWKRGERKRWRERERKETRIRHSVNYETTCLMTRPDLTRCKFSTKGWSFKPPSVGSTIPLSFLSYDSHFCVVDSPSLHWLSSYVLLIPSAPVLILGHVFQLLDTYS